MTFDALDIALVIALVALVTLAIVKPKWRRYLLYGVALVAGAAGARRVSQWAQGKAEPADDEPITDGSPNPGELILETPKYEDKTTDIVDRPVDVLTGDELDSELDDFELRARRERELRDAGLSE